MIVEIIQTNSGVFYESDGEMIAVPCQWFALCDNDAITTRSHPALGDVPICTRCDTKIDNL